MISWFKHHPHSWSSWYVGKEVLKGPYGITKHPVNERTCVICNMTQHESITKPSENCKGDSGKKV